jgi:hypothetical protein
MKGAAAAGVGGALGSIAGTPFFLVKTRLQAQAAKSIAVGHQHKHSGTFAALADIYRNEGFRGNLSKTYHSRFIPEVAEACQIFLTRSPSDRSLSQANIHTTHTYDLAMKNTADVTGDKLIVV